MALRCASICVFVPCILFLVWFRDWTLFLLVLLIAGRSNWEFSLLAAKGGHHPARYGGLLLTLGLCAHIYFAGPGKFALLLVAIALVCFVVSLRQGTEGFAGNASLTLGGTIYSGFLGSAPLLIMSAAGSEQRTEATHLVMALFICIWLTDTAAYIFGRLWGRRKLAPAISPGKTLVGFAAGVAGGLTPLLFHQFLPSTGTVQLAGLLLLTSVGGQLGDLVESAIKRDAGVKDTAPLIPGHGGMLDRFDSYFFAFPLAYLYIELLAIFEV